MTIQRKIKNVVKQTKACQKYLLLKRVYKGISKQQTITKQQFLKENFTKVKAIPEYKTKADQLFHLMEQVSIRPEHNNHFLYAPDFFVMPYNRNGVLGNYTVDYSIAINGDLKSLYELYAREDTVFGESARCMIDALALYVKRLEANDTISEQYKAAIVAIRSMFQRQANTLFEGLQRILFLNQMLWQTARNLIGATGQAFDGFVCQRYRGRCFDQGNGQTNAKGFLQRPA